MAGRGRAQAGVATIEFAAVCMVLILLVIVLMEASWQLLTGAALDHAAREASRFGVTGASVPSGMTPAPPTREAAVTTLILQSSGGFLITSRLTVTLQSYAGWNGGTATAGAGAGGSAVQYALTYTQPFLTGLARSIIGRSAVQHVVIFWVQNEPFPTSAG
jgi:Flp pilus assembly protein TadG